MNKSNNSRRGACNAGGISAFTLIEVLTVISIIGVLAAIGAGLGGVASRKAKESTMRAQRDQIVSAIESYRATFNQYPPDGGTDYNPAANPLYYELNGTISSEQGKYYQLAERETKVLAQQVFGTIGVQGFVNSAVAPERPKSFLTGLKASQHMEVPLKGRAGTVKLELLVVPYAWPKAQVNGAPLTGRVDPAAPLEKRLANPWRYIASRPTNNPAAFDLWAEAVVGRKRVMIANW